MAYSAGGAQDVAMSRVVGILSTDQTRPSLEYPLKQMFWASCSSLEWHRVAYSFNAGYLGWCGWTTPQIAHYQGIFVTLDGVIHNPLEWEFAGSDAELLAHLYRSYGPHEAFRRIQGDFAAALYDPDSRTLWLARDRFGIKPLYYVCKDAWVAFASRPKALLVLPSVSREVNRRYVACVSACNYRTFDQIPEQSPYVDVAQVPAAHLLQIKDGRVITTTYWSFQQQALWTESRDEMAERYRDLLRDSVSVRLRTCKNPAFTLSGGMDSSSVLGCALASQKETLHAFSAVYDDATYDESQDIQKGLDSERIVWHPVRISSPDLSLLLPEMIEVHDEPVATATWLSHYLVCKQVREAGFEELFGGLGGDELNAGEYDHFLYFFADLRVSGRKKQLEEEIKQWIAHHDHPIFRKSREGVEDAFARLIDSSKRGRCLPDCNRLLRYASVLNPDYFSLKDALSMLPSPFQNYLLTKTFQDMVYETLPCCLRAEDRQTSAFSLGHFLPFLDHRLVEFMFRVPEDLKIHEGVTKILLREAMRGLIPEQTRMRIKKTGWNAPAHVWFLGSAKAFLSDIVHSQAFRSRSIYRMDEVFRLIEDHERIVALGIPQEHPMMWLWQLLNLELWLRWLEQLPAPESVPTSEATLFAELVSNERKIL